MDIKQRFANDISNYNFADGFAYWSFEHRYNFAAFLVAKDYDDIARDIVAEFECSKACALEFLSDNRDALINAMADLLKAFPIGWFENN